MLECQAHELTVTELNPPSDPSPTYTVIGALRASLVFLFGKIMSNSFSPYGSPTFPEYLATNVLLKLRIKKSTYFKEQKDKCLFSTKACFVLCLHIPVLIERI